MGKYDKLKKQNIRQSEVESKQYDYAKQGLEEMLIDAERTLDVYAHTDEYIDRIDSDFEKATGLNKTDISVLMVASALQIARWAVIGMINGKVTGYINESRVDHNDKSIVSMEKNKRKTYQEAHQGQGRVKSKEHRDWEQLILESVPYDITRGSTRFNVNMEGGYHRIHTLGHDPLLGWIFGTMNILSDTITLDNFRTFDVYMGSTKQWKKETNLIAAFADAYDSVKENENRLPAAIFAQAIHLKSDFNTRLGLPVPVLETFAPDLAGKLYKQGYDTLCMMKDIAVVGTQAVMAAFINLLVILIHGLYYDSNGCISREFYEIKTRKILTWSNIIASSSNLLTVAATEVAAFYTENPELAKTGIQFMDIGGYMVTCYRLISDTKYTAKIKKEFLENEWNKLVSGDDYLFCARGGENK